MRASLIALLIVASVGFFVGCASFRSVSVDQRSTITANERIYRIVLSDGEIVKCDDNELGRAMLRADGVECIKSDGAIEKIAFERIKTLYTKEVTIASVVSSGVLIGSAAAILATYLLTRALGSAW